MTKKITKPELAMLITIFKATIKSKLLETIKLFYVRSLSSTGSVSIETAQMYLLFLIAGSGDWKCGEFYQ